MQSAPHSLFCGVNLRGGVLGLGLFCSSYQEMAFLPQVVCATRELKSILAML